VNGPFEFTWLDAFSGEDLWTSVEDFEIEKRVMRTIGWVLQQDSEYMVVAGTYDESAGVCSHVLAIPRCCIMGIRDVRGMGTPIDSVDDLGDDPGVDPPDGVVLTEEEGLDSLVGVPDPGGFGVELGTAHSGPPDTLTCHCPCHTPVFGGHVKHVKPCCPAS
jgi:hypothetical protein